MENHKKITKVEMLYHDSPSVETLGDRYGGFEPGTTVLPAGYVHKDGALELPCQITFMRDVAVKLRDGITIYINIFLPEHTGKIPAIVGWGAFGKGPDSKVSRPMGPPPKKINEDDGKYHENKMQQPMIMERSSGLSTMKGPEPALWCEKGYAVVSVDPRGVGMSEGVARYFGPEDARDAYDVIEWLAQQEWCNGKIGLYGNSWYGISQWYIAAIRPPHLAAIAVMQGHGNMYEDEYVRGGIPNPDWTRDTFCTGPSVQEDLKSMVKFYPMWNSYWEDKAVKFEEIQCPAYVYINYTSGCHCHGTFEGFTRISSQDKWLYVDAEKNQPFQNERNSSDQAKFFDYYLKGIDNGWQETPKVRLSVLDPGHEDIMDRPEENWPLDRQQFKNLYFDIEHMSLSDTPVDKASSASYIADDLKGNLKFTYTFTEETEITGNSMCRLWVQAAGHDDADVYIKTMKLDKDGNVLLPNEHNQCLYGPHGRIRASHRKLDPEKSTLVEPKLTHDELWKLSPGEVVRLDIGLWPYGMKFHPGEQLCVVIAGYEYMGLTPMGGSIPQHGDNHGCHIVHAGGNYDSFIMLPFIPEK